MHCPACDKEFSPVHSRCPDCNGWLRTKGPASGATTPPRPTLTAPPLNAAPPVNGSGPQKMPSPTGGANVTLPSRPSSKLPPPAPPAAMARGGGLAGGPAGPSAPPPGPPQVLQTAAIETPQVGRGALGSGWESSGSFAAAAPAAPATQWGAPVDTGKLPAWATPSSGGLGAEPGPAPGGLGGGFGAGPSMGMAGPASTGMAGGSFGGVSSAVGMGSTGPVGGMGSGVPSTVSAPPAAGWLGGDSGTSPYAPPPARSGGWLNDGGAGEASPAPALAPAKEAPALALPDHTVAIDIGAPWDEDEAPARSSNRGIYMILAALVLGLTVFSGYIFWQRSSLKSPSVRESPTAKGDSISVGQTYLTMAKQSFKNKKWEEAQQSAEMARDLIVPLKAAPAAKVKEVGKFYVKATTRCAQALFDKAKRASQAGDTNQALGLCQQTADMYHKLPGTNKLQAQAFGLQGQIYQNLNDFPSAQSCYHKAHALNPGGGYGSMANAVRQAGAPAPVYNPATQPDAPVEQPRLGGDSAYPTGSSPGGYRPSSGPRPAAQPAQPVSAPNRPRPVNTYVPVKKPSAPRHSDQLPTYH